LIETNHLLDNWRTTTMIIRLRRQWSCLSFLRLASLGLAPVLVLCCEPHSCYSAAATEPEKAAVDPAAEAVTLSTLLTAWQARQDKLRSADISWTEQRWEISNDPPVPNLGIKAVRPAPEAYEVSSALRLDGQKSAYGYNDQSWFKGKLYKRKCVVAYDGKTSITFFPKSEEPFPSATIHTAQSNDDMGSVFLVPLMKALRPLDTAMGGCKREKLRLLDGADDIDGHRCQKVQCDSTTYWVDPARRYAIRRLVARNWAEVSIAYSQDDLRSDLPISWHIKMANGDRSMGKVTKSSINPKLPIEKFQVVLPAGTIGRDDIKRQDFLVRRDGSRMVLNSREINYRKAKELSEAERENGPKDGP
jgi:hypothetical protein